MVRPLHSATSAIMSDEVLRPAILVELFLVGQPIRLTSTKGPIDWDGKTFLANGWIQPIDGISESTDTSSYGFELSLSGVSEALISLVLSNSDAGELGTVWLALFDESGQIVGQPIRLYRGLIDSCEIDDKMDAPKVTVTLENDLAKFDQSQNFRYTDESQKALFPGDRGFQYVPKMETWQGFWGKQERPKWVKPKKPKR